MEILGSVSDSGEISLRIVCAAACAGAAALPDAGGVVDDGIGDDAHPRRLACGDHGFEFLFSAFLGVQLVTDRLI